VFIKGMVEADTIELSMYDGFRIFLLAQSFIPYLIFDKKSYGLLLVGILPTLFSILFFEFVLDTVWKVHKEVIGSDYQLMTMRTFVSYLIINSGFYALLTIVSNNDQFNEKLIHELKIKSDQVRRQNIELEENHFELAKFNQDLKELVDIKTEKISKQNAVLSKYAFTNAHKIRGPLARILGLVGLQRMDSGLGFPWLLDKIEGEAKNIDSVIKTISVDLNQIDEDYNNNSLTPSERDTTIHKKL
jgi:signal transduction histidine kinase